MTRAEVGREMSAKEMTDDVSCILRHREQLAWQKQLGKKEESKRVGERKAFQGREEKQSHLRVDSSEE